MAIYGRMSAILSHGLKIINDKRAEMAARAVEVDKFKLILFVIVLTFCVVIAHGRIS